MRKYLFGAQKYSKVLFPPYYIDICYVFLRNQPCLHTPPHHTLQPSVIYDRHRTMPAAAAQMTECKFFSLSAYAFSMQAQDLQEAASYAMKHCFLHCQKLLPGVQEAALTLCNQYALGNDIMPVVMHTHTEGRTACVARAYAYTYLNKS